MPVDNMPTPTRESPSVVEFVLDLFARRGAEEYMGEPVSMAQHMEQSAACAAADGAPDSLIIASLLHDIGHFIGEFPIDALDNGIDNYHEDVAADFLARYFPASVTEPIHLHVSAKRYLCAVDNEYFGRLSPASVNSLNVQGGPMSPSETREFEARPYYRDAVRLRFYDDDGKVEGLNIDGIASYRAMMEALLS